MVMLSLPKSLRQKRWRSFNRVADFDPPSVRLACVDISNVSRRSHVLKPEADAAPQKPGLLRPSHQSTG